SSGFNVEGCRLLLGIEKLQAKQPAEAEADLEEAARSDDAATRSSARYYLALAEYDLGFGPSGTGQAYRSYDDALSAPADVSPKGILSATRGLLDRVAAPAWFASAALLGKYDGNVGLIPGQNLASGAAAKELALSAAAGRMSSAANAWQWVG